MTGFVLYVVKRAPRTPQTALLHHYSFLYHNTLQWCSLRCNFMQVKIHEGNHTGEKPFNCTKCGKSFSGSKHLKYHQRINEGKKPWKSQELFHITINEMNHNGEKPFKCIKCGKSFSWSRDLKYHQRILEGNNHWSAPNVTGAFPHQVKIHEGNHTGEKPFNCTKCGKSFSGSKYLKYHQRVHEWKKSLKSQELFHIRWRFKKGITLERQRSHTSASSVARAPQRDWK